MFSSKFSQSYSSYWAEFGSEKKYGEFGEQRFVIQKQVTIMRGMPKIR